MQERHRFCIVTISYLDPNFHWIIAKEETKHKFGIALSSSLGTLTDTRIKTQHPDFQFLAVIYYTTGTSKNTTPEIPTPSPT